MSQGPRMHCRQKIPIHGLTVLFLKPESCLLIYNHPYQPEEIEGDQAECQLYCWLFLRHDILVQAPLDNSLEQN